MIVNRIAKNFVEIYLSEPENGGYLGPGPPET